MFSFARLIQSSLVVPCILLGSLPVIASGANVVAHTRDGRTLQGEVDVRSNAQALWLRSDSEDLVFAYSIDWHEIERLEVSGLPLEVQELQNNLADFTTTARKGMLTEYALPTSIETSNGHIVNNQTTRPWVVPIRRPPIVAVEAEAALANLDRTVEPDGLRLLIAPVDHEGVAWPVRGNVTARLVGQKQDHHTGEIRFLQLEQWNVPVAESEFDDGVTSVTLRFRHTRPELDFELCPLGQLHVRLGANGEGNFETSIPLVLQDWNPFRDNLQYQQGSRFFRGELTHNPHQIGPLTPAWITSPRPF